MASYDDHDGDDGDDDDDDGNDKKTWARLASIRLANSWSTSGRSLKLEVGHGCFHFCILLQGFLLPMLFNILIDH